MEYVKIKGEDIEGLFTLTGKKKHVLKEVLYTDKEGTTHQIKDIEYMSLYFEIDNTVEEDCDENCV